jgi:hypothetical protein
MFRIAVLAESGESIDSVARRAILLAETLKAAVMLIHSDTPVEVQARDRIVDVVQKWSRKRKI